MIKLQVTRGWVLLMLISSLVALQGQGCGPTPTPEIIKVTPVEIEVEPIPLAIKPNVAILKPGGQAAILVVSEKWKTAELEWEVFSQSLKPPGELSTSKGPTVVYQAPPEGSGEVTISVRGRTEEAIGAASVSFSIQLLRGVSVLGVWRGDELAAFQEVVFPLTEETGMEIRTESTQDLRTTLTTVVQAGDPPDLAILDNPGHLVEFAKAGYLVDLSTFLDMNQLRSDYAHSWLDLASVDGKLYGILIWASIKSLVWYVPANFEAAGYEVPTTWDEMIALSDQIVADGGTPWCLGIESGAATGWVATDWIEDIMLRTAGPEVYDTWMNHEIPWTDPAVRTAFEFFGQIARNDDYVVGGAAGVNSIFFGDSPVDLFTDPPGCYMHRQGSFITDFFPEGVTEEDYALFPLPPIAPEFGTPLMGWAYPIVMFNDTPEARALMQYLASPEAHEIWASQGGFLSPNKRVSLDVYPTGTERALAQVLTSAEVFRFDASDLMPSAVGTGSFWTGAADYSVGLDLSSVLEAIEASAADAYP